MGFIKPQECHRINTSKRNRTDYGMDERVFVNKDSPDYQFNWGKKFTLRQKSILDGNIPIESVRLTELAAIIRKAEQIGDLDSAEKAEVLYNAKKYPDDEVYHPTMNYKEALDFLDANNDI